MQIAIKRNFQRAARAYIASQLGIAEADIDNEKLNSIMQQLADTAIDLYNK